MRSVKCCASNDTLAYIPGLILPPGFDSSTVTRAERLSRSMTGLMVSTRPAKVSSGNAASVMVARRPFLQASDLPLEHLDFDLDGIQLHDGDQLVALGHELTRHDPQVGDASRERCADARPREFQFSLAHAHHGLVEPAPRPGYARPLLPHPGISDFVVEEHDLFVVGLGHGEVAGGPCERERILGGVDLDEERIGADRVVFAHHHVPHLAGDTGQEGGAPEGRRTPGRRDPDPQRIAQDACSRNRLGAPGEAGSEASGTSSEVASVEGAASSSTEPGATSGRSRRRAEPR